jgi:hypothetical protein
MLSLLSKEKAPLLPTTASANPLLGMLPFAHPWTSGVMSITTNWFTLDPVTLVGWLLVADDPSAGALL